MPTVCSMIGARRGIAAPALRAALVAAAALLTCACNTTQQVAGVPEEPTDYRMRHPIVIREADRTLQMFIGSNRSELTPSHARSFSPSRRAGAAKRLAVWSSTSQSAAATSVLRPTLCASPIDHRCQRRGAARRGADLR